MSELKNLHYIISQPDIRLDKFISEQVPALSRTQAQLLIREGNVKVNGEIEKTGYKLVSGDSVDVHVPTPTPSRLSPEDIPVRIIYEDKDVLVVDKPAGLTVHPAPGHKGGTLVNAVLSHLPNLADEGGRPGIVHRLDKDTSGAMVIAKNPVALARLSEQFKRHEITKIYLTLVEGRLKPEQGVIEAHIGRDTADRKKMMVSGESRGREARTGYKIIRYLSNYSLLEVKPETGRTHQIRVHLAAIGYPVFGDATYGLKSPVLSRQFLHAHRLGFHHPSTGEYMEFTSELPVDLCKALADLG
jgi:23S rRNA pseudouridine1911/1915/1917 synthase